MSDSKFYETNPDDPEAPVVLPFFEYDDEDFGHRVKIEPGMSVRSTRAPRLEGPLVVTELIGFTNVEYAPIDLGNEFIDRIPISRSLHHVLAVLNDGEYEVNPENLAPVS